VEAASWDEIIEESGLSRAEINATAEMYANSKKTICGWCLGVTQQRNGVDNVSMIVNLLLVGGNIGRPGAGTVCIRGHSNVQGDRTMGIWERPPKAFLDALAKEFKFDPPKKWGFDTVETLHAMFQGRSAFFRHQRQLSFEYPGYGVRRACNAEVQAYCARINEAEPVAPYHGRSGPDPAVSGPDRRRCASDGKAIRDGGRLDGDYQSVEGIISACFA
jgi:anaerobic selenocysteine-containing dehydrogenase